MTKEIDLILKNEVFQIAGCAMEVLNVLGHGLLEKPYENALAVEFEILEIPFVQQKRFNVIYKDTKVGEYIPDLIIFDKIIVETKVISKIGKAEMGQMLNYLKITKMKVGLILNFKAPVLEWKRVIH